MTQLVCHPMECRSPSALLASACTVTTCSPPSIPLVTSRTAHSVERKREGPARG